MSATAAVPAAPPYPQSLCRWVEWQGRRLLLRPIRPEDDAQHRAFLERLDPEDVRMRVFQSRRELPDSELERLTHIDYDREMAFVLVAPGGLAGHGADETLGVVRAIADADNVEAEFAIVVRSDCKRRGFGRLLMRRIVEHVRSRGTQRLVGDILRENVPMLQLAFACGFTVDRAKSSGDVVRVVLPLGEAPGLQPH